MRVSRSLQVASLAIIFIITAGFLLRRQFMSADKTLHVRIEDRSIDESRPPASTQAVLISAPSDNASLSAPHRENSRTILNLKWTFGGKAQYGWYLYTALIGELINSNEPPTSLAFAAEVARWQGSAGLRPTGIVDEETLMGMVKVWQERRSADRTYPTAEQLVTAPATEFYDSSRSLELRQVERRTYLAYKRLLQAAIADRALNLAVTAQGELAAGEKRLRIISAFRSREYQERLRRQSPNSGRAGLALNSPHFTGRALDLYIAGEPVETKDSNRALQVNTPLYRWLVRNAGRFGFRPYFFEPWHWEFDPNFEQ